MPTIFLLCRWRRSCSLRPETGAICDTAKTASRTDGAASVTDRGGGRSVLGEGRYQGRNGEIVGYEAVDQSSMRPRFNAIVTACVRSFAPSFESAGQFPTDPLELDDAAADGNCHRLRPVAGAELVHDGTTRKRSRVPRKGEGDHLERGEARPSHLGTS